MAYPSYLKDSYSKERTIVLETPATPKETQQLSNHIYAELLNNLVAEGYISSSNADHFAQNYQIKLAHDNCGLGTLTIEPDHRLSDENRRQANEIQDLEKKRAKWIDQFKKYSFHLSDCDKVSNLRPRLRIKCTCGLDNILTQIGEHSE